MKVCPNCRAGRRWIETEQEDFPATFKIELTHECLRCGTTRTEEMKV